MWTLVIITIMQSTTGFEIVERNMTMSDCFQLREQVVKTLGEPPLNYQAVCVRTAKEV